LTPAIRFLKQRNIPFKVAEYDPLEKGAVFASEAIEMPIEKTIKTLVVELSEDGYLIVLMPGNKTISFKRLSRLRGVKRASMASENVAERLTGYRVGGISPFATKQPLFVAMDKELLGFDKVAINGGKRGLMLIMRPLDILETVAAKPIEL
jgi:Cys-tRNA(Pro)/Cys-tRNA(Cys) deacylase